MSPTARLYHALTQYLRQCNIQWQDVRHLQTLCWMIVGMIESQNVHLNGFGVYVKSRAQVAQSHQRRFRRWLSNRRIDVMSAHHALIRQALSQWKSQRLYLSLDRTVVWNCFCIVWVGVVYRGRTIPIAWRIVAQSSRTVRLPSEVLCGGVLFRFEIKRIQSGSLQATGQICPIPIVWGNCLNDGVSGVARGTSGGFRQASPSRCSLATRHELSQTGMELDSTCHYSPMKDSSVSVLIQPA